MHLHWATYVPVNAMHPRFGTSSPFVGGTKGSNKVSNLGLNRIPAGTGRVGFALCNASRLERIWQLLAMPETTL